MGRNKQFDTEQALAAATDVFWKKGYAATTPANLVDALGIGKGSLYNAFPSKHDLFAQSFGRYGDSRVAGLRHVLSQPGPMKEKLRIALAKIATPDDPLMSRRGCMAVNAAAELGSEDAIAASIARSVFERMENVLREAIEEGQRTGELRPDLDPRQIASLFLLTIIGMGVSVRIADDADRLNQATLALLSLV